MTATGLALLMLGACVSVNETPKANRISHEEVSTELFARAQALYLAEDYEAAAVMMRPLAEHGHLQAQYALGYMYYFGLGVPRNEREAIRWLGVAAARGNAKAKTALEILKLGEPAPHNAP